MPSGSRTLKRHRAGICSLTDSSSSRFGSVKNAIRCRCRPTCFPKTSAGTKVVCGGWSLAVVEVARAQSSSQKGQRDTSISLTECAALMSNDDI